MNNGIKALVFVYDGTLRPVDLFRIYEAHLKIYKFLKIKQNGHYESFEKYLEWKGVPEQFWIEKNRFYSQKIFHSYYDQFVPLFRWTECVIKKLSKKYNLAILSNSAEFAIEKQLRENNLLEYFKIIIGCITVKDMKPHPEGLIRIMNELQVEPKNILLIGDTKTDIEIAENTGVKLGVVGWGIDDLNELSFCDPDYMFQNPMEIILKLI